MKIGEMPRDDWFLLRGIIFILGIPLLCIIVSSFIPEKIPDACPRCGNEFIFGTDAFTGKKSVGCFICGWRHKQE